MVVVMAVKILIAIAAASLAVGITLAQVGGDGASRQYRKWQDLCIPKEYDPVFARDFSSGGSALGALGRFIKQLPHQDVQTVPVATVYFTGKELAQAIPGYKTHGFVGAQHIKVHLGIMATIKPAELANGTRVMPGDRNIYNLRGKNVYGDWGHAIVKNMPNLPYYKAVPIYPGTHNEYFMWVMTSVDLGDKKARPPIAPITWYIATCSRTGHLTPWPYECTRRLVDPGFEYFVRYHFVQPNAHLIPQIDAFIEAKIRSWRANCQAKSRD